MYKLFSIFIFIFLAIQANSQENNNSPNILIIQTDDMGFDDLSFHGRKDLETPNLDKLASQSVIFTDFTVSSVCAPTRASLLTGRHFLKTGVAGVHGGHDFVNLDEKLLPQFFKEAGYVTGIFGKWHSGKTDGYFPWDRGFDEAYMAKLYQYFPATGFYNDEPVTENRWTSDVVTDYAINFLKKNKEKKFLAYVPYMDPHGLWRAPKDRVKKYIDKGLDSGYATLCGMLDFVDENIGRLLKELDSLGLSKNTVVFFLSDNGPQPSDKKYGKLTEREWQQRNPSGYPGWKAVNWANGMKSPLFVRWPNHFQPASVTRLVDVTDILPTLLDIIGMKNIKTGKPFDGRSITPYLYNQVNGLSERKVYSAKWYVQIGKSNAESYLPISPDVRKRIKFSEQDLSIRDEHFKLMLNPVHTPRPNLLGNCLLFDIKNDPLETVNVNEKFPEKEKSMLADLRAWYSDIVQNEKSFQAPVFQIGWNRKKEAAIPAYGASKITGNLVNHDHFLGNWKTKGDKADYKINVLIPGYYHVLLTAGKKPEGDVVLKISNKKRKIVKKINSSLEWDIGSIYLAKGLSTLSIEIVNASNNALIGEMKEIKLSLEK